jgi:hypothetical protein
MTPQELQREIEDAKRLVAQWPKGLLAGSTTKAKHG